MSVADRLLQRFESNISQSLGAGESPVTQTAPEVPTDRHAATPAPGPGEGRTRARDIGAMDIRNIVPDPDQPRKEFDEDAISRLSESLAKHGQLQPIRVRWTPALGKWTIISGERRYRAAIAAGLASVTCHFVERELSSSELLQEQLVENCMREDLRPVEQARAFRALMDSNGWSARRVADELNVASSTVVKALALLKLPEDIRARVDAGEIPPTAAYELAKLEGAEEQRAAAGKIASSGLTREQTVALVQGATGKNPQARRRKKRVPATDPSPPAPPRFNPGVSVVDRYSCETAEHAILSYVLSDGTKLTVTTAAAGTAGDLATGLALAFEDVRDRLERTLDQAGPWCRDPVLR